LANKERATMNSETTHPPLPRHQNSLSPSPGHPDWLTRCLSAKPMFGTNSWNPERSASHQYDDDDDDTMRPDPLQ
jgi:hypothetical protein